MSEQEQIKRCQEGNIEAYEELIGAYENKIVNYCYMMLRNHADAEDAAQEVFVKVFRFMKNFTGQSSFSTWLYKIASNVCLDFLRKKKRQSVDAVSIHQTSADGEEYVMPILDTAKGPYEQAQLSEAQRFLAKALNELSAEQRQVIVLRDVEGLSYEEIAEIVGVAVGTVKSRINRARQSLQKILAPHRELFLL
ncbi:MAG: sigma-70 family RNA polymerase sigma factor [Clostridia bacterium]|nr:sigma-70 family RNA polymerase sigma factor [Clostridia bacterium]